MTDSVICHFVYVGDVIKLEVKSTEGTSVYRDLGIVSRLFPENLFDVGGGFWYYREKLGMNAFKISPGMYVRFEY